LSGFLIYKATGHTLQFKILLMLIAMSDTDYDTHLKDLFVVNILFMFAVIMLFHFGVISEATATRPDGLIRHSLGYIYPLDFHAHLVSIVLMYLYFRKDKFGIIDLALINAANFVMYKVTDSRTDMLVIILGSVILFIMNKVNTDKLINRFTEGLAVIYTACIGIIPFILTKIYDPANSFMSRLNRILSDRLTVQQRVVSETGIPMFGRFMIWNGNGGEGVVHVEEYNWIDSSFLRDSIDYGWVFVVLMLIAFILLYHHLFEKKNKEGILVITLFLLNALLEHNTMLTYVFPVMLMLSEIIMKSNRSLINRLIQ
jgi:hypothetical protein